LFIAIKKESHCPMARSLGPITLFLAQLFSVLGFVVGRGRPGTIIYTLQVTVFDEVKPLILRAGQEPALVVRAYCQAHSLDEASCQGILDHMCSDARITCRGTHSVLQDPVEVGFCSVQWQPRAQLEKGLHCVLTTPLLRSDAFAALDELSMSQDETVDPALPSLLQSLVDLHCLNLSRLEPNCACTSEAKTELLSRLAHELERFRWSPFTNHYVKLGVSRYAERGEIKKAYRRLSFLLHPDRNPHDQNSADQIFKLNAAHEVLSDEHARRLYDAETFGESLPAQSRNSVRVRPGVTVSFDEHGNMNIVI